MSRMPARTGDKLNAALPRRHYPSEPAEDRASAAGLRLRATLAEARAAVAGACRLLGSEVVPVGRARERVLAEDLRAPHSLPLFANAAMDGYAVRAADTTITGAALRLAGDVYAGAAPEASLAAGTCTEIATGAPLPPGADAVVRYERAKRAGAMVHVREPVAPGTDVRPAGEDVARGDLVLRRGTLLGPGEVALLAALGRVQVRCARKPRVGIATTGDELLPASAAALPPGRLRDSNLPMLAALIERDGGELVAVHGPVPDRPRAVRRLLRRLIDECDAVVVSGGVSVGRRDYVATALAAVGVEERVRGLALRPGRPARFGVAPENGTLVFALPGNPVAVFVLHHLLVRFALAALRGTSLRELWVQVALAQDVATTPVPCETFFRVRLESSPGRCARAVPCGRVQGSHAIASLVQADALVRVASGATARAGDEVEVLLTRTR